MTTAKKPYTSAQHTRDLKKYISAILEATDKSLAIANNENSTKEEKDSAALELIKTIKKEREEYDKKYDDFKPKKRD